MQCVNILVKSLNFFHLAMKIPHLDGLSPCVRSDCQIMIFGSMPSAASLRAGGYYAHPQNRFWPVMGHILQFNPHLEPSIRLAALQAHRIGLWDVIGRCRRRGSLDAAIEVASIQVNPIASLLASLAQLERILCNGAVAHQVWKQKVAATLTANYTVVQLPSTSAANASWSMEALVRQWRRALDGL